MLNQTILDRFERALASAGASITGYLAPGATDDELDSLERDYGLRLPAEARRWWQWHNGVSAEVRAPQWDIVPRRTLFDLATALDAWDEERGTTEQLEGATARVPPVSDSPWIFFDCGENLDDPVPIFVGDHGEPQRLALPSIGELVLIWTELIEHGVYRTSDDGTWQWDFARVPEGVRQLGVY